MFLKKLNFMAICDRISKSRSIMNVYPDLISNVWVETIYREVEIRFETEEKKLLTLVSRLLILNENTLRVEYCMNEYVS